MELFSPDVPSNRQNENRMRKDKVIGLLPFFSLAEYSIIMVLLHFRADETIFRLQCSHLALLY